MSRQKAEIDPRKQKSLKKTIEKEKTRAEPIDEKRSINQEENRDQDKKT